MSLAWASGCLSEEFFFALASARIKNAFAVPKHDSSPNHPHQLILNLGKPQTNSGFRYVPRQGDGAGRIKHYRVFIGDRLVNS